MPERCRAPQDGATPLHLATNHGQEAVMEMLLEAGAATDAKDKVTGKRGSGTRSGRG